MYQDMRFEYKLVESRRADDWIQKMNDLGKEGWVLKVYVSDAKIEGQPSWAAIMQRRIS